MLIRLDGETKKIKEAIKARGWRWNGEAWWKTADETIRPETDEQKKEFATKYQGNLKGCRLLWDGRHVIWTSPSYRQDTGRITRGEAIEARIWGEYDDPQKESMGR